MAASFVVQDPTINIVFEGFYTDQSLAHGRYTILRKLGWGIASSVLLAKDNQLQSYVAPKIATAFWTGDLPDHEALILRRIQDANPNHSGRHFCSHLIDQFTVESDHGNHSVIVTPVSGPNVFTAFHQMLAKKKTIPLPVVKQWAREMLLALDYLHTDVGVIHSDFRLPNILLRAHDAKELSSVLAENPVEFHPKNDAHGSVPTFVSQPLPVSRMEILQRHQSYLSTLADQTGLRNTRSALASTCIIGLPR